MTRRSERTRAGFVRALCRASLAATVCLIVVFSIVPDPFRVQTIAFADKLKHIAAYCVLGFACVASFIKTGNKAAVAGLSILSGVLLGGALECVQAFVARTPDLADLACDIAVSVIGSLSALPFSRFFFPGGNAKHARSESI
jgi:VanZ family protein